MRTRLNKRLGDEIVAVICPVCGKTHPVEYGMSQPLVNGEWAKPQPSKALRFYRCRKKIYLGSHDFAGSQAL